MPEGTLAPAGRGTLQNLSQAGYVKPSGEPGSCKLRWSPAATSGVAADQRTARFRCVVVFVEDPDAKPRMFKGSCSGRILSEPDGAGGFGYDPLFFSDDLQSSFGRVSESAKAAVSHRGKAFRKFAEWLAE